MAHIPVNAQLYYMKSMHTLWKCLLAWRSNVFERNPEIKKEGKIVVDTKFKVYYKKFSKVLSEREGDFVLGNKLTHADFWLANFISMWNEPLVREILLHLATIFKIILTKFIYLHTLIANE